MKKIVITEKKAYQFNRMLAVLRRIHKDYQTPEQMHRQCKRDGWDFNETQGMAYENIQSEAAAGARGVRPILIDTK